VHGLSDCWRLRRHSRFFNSALNEALDLFVNPTSANARRVVVALERLSIPKSVKRAEVPLDPALAIANRFMKLAKA
jgi:hypothetical protein